MLRLFLHATVPMEARIAKFCTAFGILLLFGSCFAPRTEAVFNPKNFERKLDALNRILKYIYDRPEQMNIDATFAITLTEANLLAVLSHDSVLHLGNKLFGLLHETTALCIYVQKTLKHVVTLRNEREQFLDMVLNNPHMWIKPILWKNLSSVTTLNINQQVSYSTTIKSIWYGKPNETESMDCLSNITRGYKKCQIPENCVDILINHNDSTGYPLTHKLLLVQVARLVKCPESKSLQFSHLIPKYCSSILQNLFNLESWNFPSIAPDLIAEQIVLCGMEGYLEFIDKYYKDLILSWQHKSGCFSALGFPQKHKITRRSTSITDFGCDSHATAVTAAALAVFIRAQFENELAW